MALEMTMEMEPCATVAGFTRTFKFDEEEDVECQYQHPVGCSIEN